MSRILTGRNVAIAGGLGGALLLFSQTRTAQKLDPLTYVIPPYLRIPWTPLGTLCAATY